MLNKNSSLHTEDVTQTFANVIFPVTKFTAAIYVTTNNPWVSMIDKLWVIICHILSLFLYANSLFIRKHAATLSAGTTMTPDSDTWEETASFLYEWKGLNFQLQCFAHWRKENVFIPLGRCCFDSYYQLTSAFFQFGYHHYHQGRYCFWEAAATCAFRLTVHFSMCEPPFEMHKQQSRKSAMHRPQLPSRQSARCRAV